MSFHHVKIEDQQISRNDIDAIKDFLLNQPKWRMIRDDRDRATKHRFAKTGVEQHWLWREENQATSWADFIMKWGSSVTPENERWIKTDRAHLIMPGELFLCDLVGGELWIGRMLHNRADKIAQITDDMNRDYGNAFNGYAILPLKEIKAEPLT